jgi:hypothetical protein
VAEIVCWDLANKGKIFGLERERKAEVPVMMIKVSYYLFYGKFSWRNGISSYYTI